MRSVGETAKTILTQRTEITSGEDPSDTHIPEGSNNNESILLPETVAGISKKSPEFPVHNETNTLPESTGWPDKETPTQAPQRDNLENPVTSSSIGATSPEKNTACPDPADQSTSPGKGQSP